MVVPLVVTMAGTFISVRANLWQNGPPRVPRIALGAMAVAYAGVIIWVLPALERRKVVPDVARWVASHAVPADRIATYRLNRWNPAFRFYVDRHTMTLETVAEARAFFEKPEPFYCAMLAPAFDEFVAQGVPLRMVYRREGMWATSGRVRRKESQADSDTQPAALSLRYTFMIAESGDPTYLGLACRSTSNPFCLSSSLGIIAPGRSVLEAKLMEADVKSAARRMVESRRTTTRPRMVSLVRPTMR